MTEENVEMVQLKTAPEQITPYMETVEQANELEIASELSAEVGGELLGVLAELRKSVVLDFAATKDAANKVHKEVCSQESRHLDPIKDAEKKLKAALKEWVAEQNRLARIEQQRIADENRKAREEEQAAKDAEAAELAAKVDTKAEELEDDGELEEAEQLRDEHAAHIAAQPEPEPEVEEPEIPLVVPEVKPSTVKTRKKVIVRITSKREFLRGAIESRELMEFVTINEPKLLKYLKDEGMEISQGVRGAHLEEDFDIGGR